MNAHTLDRLRNELRGVILTIGLVALLTLGVFAAVQASGLGHGSVVYLLPVLIAAIRWGIVSALVAAVCGVLASAFFFYPPLYSLRITDPQEVVNLFLFIVVAVVVSQLATRLRRQLELAQRREVDLRDLYAFSRRLAGAFGLADIHAAIEDHLASVLQSNVILFAGGRDGGSGRRPGAPPPVLDAVAKVAAGGAHPTRRCTPAAAKSGWCTRCRRKTPSSGSSPSISAASRRTRSTNCACGSTPCWRTPPPRSSGSTSRTPSARRACARKPSSCARR